MKSSQPKLETPSGPTYIRKSKMEWKGNRERPKVKTLKSYRLDPVAQKNCGGYSVRQNRVDSNGRRFNL